MKLKCEICGKEIEESKYYDHFICSSACFSEYFWRSIVAEKDSHVIIKGECYSVGPEDSPQSFRGLAGRRFLLENLLTKERIETTNLCCQGKIPKKFLKSLPNTHKFI